MQKIFSILSTASTGQQQHNGTQIELMGLTCDHFTPNPAKGIAKL